MTPISSEYDIRLVTLIKLSMDVIESLALETSSNPEQLLAEYLYLSSRRINEIGNEAVVNKLTTNYPMLNEAIK